MLTDNSINAYNYLDHVSSITPNISDCHIWWRFMRKCGSNTLEAFYLQFGVHFTNGTQSIEHIVYTYSSE